jgi:tetratricopeptide (TPR) repeat protein
MGSLSEPGPLASAAATSSGATPSEEETKARSPALLASELSGLEARFASLPKDAPDRPAVARQIAEDYVEAENVALRAKTQAVVDRDPSKEAEAGATSTRSRAGAEKYYRLIIDEYPSYPELDKVLYYLAYEYEQSNDSAGARKGYFELIQKRPNSRYIPNAYLAFGEMFFNEAAGDPAKWELARMAYEKVIAYPPPPNEVYGYAWYKLAYVFWNTNDLVKALAAFKKTIDYGVAFPELPNATKLASSARRDWLAVSALVAEQPSPKAPATSSSAP